MFSWNSNMNEAPKDGTYILICKRGMSVPWQVSWYNGSRKQGWRSISEMVMFEPEFWMLVKCPE